VLAEGQDGVHRSSDKFCFPFFRLSAKHVQMINTIMLDQADHISTIVFRSQPALRKALEYYLDMPTQTRGLYSVKTISERADDPKLLLLQKLEHIAQHLGSKVKARYHVDPLVDSFEDVIFQVLKDVPPLPNDPISSYMRILVGLSHKLGLTIRDIQSLD
jgi:hypothetical protein